MNEAETFSPKFLKVQFSKLVREAGKQDAAAAVLGVSRQRIGQLCDTRNAEHAKEIPTYAQIWALEQFCGRSVVFRALAEAIEPPTLPADACPLKEAHDVITLAARAGPLAHDVMLGKPGAAQALCDLADQMKVQVCELQAVSNVQTLRVAS